MMTHDVKAGGDCLPLSILDSAQWQGVTLPGGIHDVNTLRTYVGDQIRNTPHQFAPILTASVGQYLADDLSPDQVGAVATRLGLPTPVPTPQEQAAWQAGRSSQAQPTAQEVAAWHSRYAYNRLRDRVAQAIDTPVSRTAALTALVNSYGADLSGAARLAGVAYRRDQNGRPLRPADLLEDAARTTELWNSSVGDDIPRVFAQALGINLVVRQGGVNLLLLPNAAQSLILHRVNQNHYQSFRPPPAAPGS
jgi:hypothetical protein